MSKTIILVSVGVFQEYIIDNINQLLLLGHNIHVITNKSFFKKLEDFKNKIIIVDADLLKINEYFDNNSKHNYNFRNGFWKNTSKRLFLIYEYMKLCELKNVFHIENDVLLYSSLDFQMSNNVYLTMDANNRCIPGIIYIPDSTLIEPLIHNYNFRLNDMSNMALFYKNNKNTVKLFPIIDNISYDKTMYNENFQEFNSIFDAAAIGQYLGGVDPRNSPGDTRGFVNETCVVKYDKYEFTWIKKENLYYPYMKVGDTHIKINNLHIHSKNLKQFLIKENVKSEIIFNKNTKNELFDIVIPVGPNDKDIIEKQIKFTKKNIVGYRKIYLVCYDPTISINDCITINENIFPFSIKTVADIHGKRERNGWYLQQLIKLYAGIVIPDILDRYLVIDSDTFFLKETIFIRENKCLYNYGNEYHLPYFSHMKRLDPEFTKVLGSRSAICHHMMFEVKYIKELFNRLETKHGDNFYNIFLKCVDSSDYNNSGASEYELYLNYMFKYHKDDIIIRPLSWRNTNILFYSDRYDYISYHWYMR